MLIVHLVVWVVTDRGLGPGLFGLALSAAGAGAFLGTAVSLRVAARLGHGRSFACALTLSTGTPLLIAVLPGAGTSLATALASVQFVSGVGLGVANVLSITLRQTVIPRGGLARSNGGYRLLNYGVLPLGSALGGVLGHTVGSRAGVAVGAVGLAASALPMLTRRIRSLRSPEDARTPQAPDVAGPHRVPAPAPLARLKRQARLKCRGRRPGGRRAGAGHPGGRCS
ncbi:MFS transporter [Micromonospora sp. IBHARD004]|uniref:MFS transporter n=1 Tax=Micromonospora sp. IBHARD004 TaxID=3457764 RepID=UPI004059DDE7